jgi:hypothetical protein
MAGRPRSDRIEVRETILAACREIAREGGYPSVRLLAARTHHGDKTCAAVRQSLIDDGLVDAGPLRKNQYSGPEDPLAEHPDDPDADEIRARIAEVAKRHTYYNNPRATEYARVVHRCELPLSLPRSRQRITA